MVRWTKEEIEFLTNNYMNMSYSDISLKFNRSEASIRAKCFELGLVKNSQWNEDEINYLVKNYEYMKTCDIAKALNRTEVAVRVKARKLSLNKPAYTCDYDYFETIDTEEKAYWLGFIYADGWVYINEKNNAGTLGIELQIGDIQHLKKFNKSIKGNYKIFTRERVSNLNNKKSESCVIRVYSIKLATDLINLGVIPNKTFEIQLPRINDNLMCHFIRGFFDGDGCICFNSNKSSDLQINFTSASHEFIEQLRSYLYKFNIYSYITAERDKSTYRLYIKGLENVDNMWNLMYSDATIFLDRKKEKKERLYKLYDIAHRLPRQSEMIG